MSAPNDKKPQGHSRRRRHKSRREFVKRAAAGGAAATVAISALPKKWTKPVVDSVLLPVHAQASGGALGTITAAWFLGDDAPGSYDTGITGTTNVTDAFLYDDGTDMLFQAQLSPPAAGVTVSVNIDVSGTTFSGFTEGLPTPTATNDAGMVDFGEFDPTNDDFGDTPGDGTITVTFSAPGYSSAVVRLNVS